MRNQSILLAIAAGALATASFAAPAQHTRPIGVETKIVNAGNGGIRNWQAGPPDSGILYMQDRTLKWYEVTMSGPCIQTRGGPVTVHYTTDTTGTFDRFSSLSFPDFGNRTCGVRSIKTSAPPQGQPGAPPSADDD